MVNVFSYAYPDVPGEAQVACREVRLDNVPYFCFKVQDWGAPFDPFLEAPVPDVSLGVDERPVGGLGIHLIKSVVAHYTYAYYEQSNIIELYFALPGVIRVLSFCLAVGMFVSGTASAGVILHEELSTDERPAQRLRPVHPGGQSESSLPPRPSIPTENLLDQMDIYALSPHAAALSLPRMVSPQLVLRAHVGKGTLPPPAVWRELVAKASGRYGLDPRLIAAVIKVESISKPSLNRRRAHRGSCSLCRGRNRCSALSILSIPRPMWTREPLSAPAD